jgi:hypothetical protein
VRPIILILSVFKTPWTKPTVCHLDDDHNDNDHDDDDDCDDDDVDVGLIKIKTSRLQNLLSIYICKTHRLVLKKA